MAGVRNRDSESHHRQYLAGEWVSPQSFYWVTVDLTDIAMDWYYFFNQAHRMRDEGGVLEFFYSTEVMEKWRVTNLDAWLDRVREVDARRRLVAKAVA